MTHELEVQKLLRSGITLQEITDTYGISHTISPDGKLVNLKYSQIDSDKTLLIVQQCRSTILEMNTWKIISRGFERFFNYNELNNCSFNFNSKHIKVYEKVDGSIIQLFFYKNNWQISTSSVIGAECSNDQHMVFAKLFEKALPENFYENLHENYIYIFELISPFNRIITKYNQTQLVLLSIRSQLTLDELLPQYVTAIANNLNVRCPVEYSYTDIESTAKAVEEIPTLDEGFVVVDFEKIGPTGSYPRIKLKSSTYVKLHLLKSNVSPRNLIQQVLNNESAEILSYFPEYKLQITKIEDEYQKIKNNICHFWNIVSKFIELDGTPREIKSKFAKVVFEHVDSQYAGYMFELYKGDGVPALFSNLLHNNKLLNALIERIYYAIDFTNL